MKSVKFKDASKFSLLLIIASSFYSCKKPANSERDGEAKLLSMEASSCSENVADIDEVKKHILLKEDQSLYSKKLSQINKVAFSELYLQHQAITDMIDFLNNLKLKNGSNEFIDAKIAYFKSEKTFITKYIQDLKKENSLIHIGAGKKPLLNSFDRSKNTINVENKVTNKIEIYKLSEQQASKLVSYEKIISGQLSSDFSTSKLKKIKKYSYKGIEKFASGANKYNVLMNFITMPNVISNINESFKLGNTSAGIRESLHFSANNAELALDLLKASKGKVYWNNHQNAFKHITKLQVALNLASAGFEIYNAVELFKAANLEIDPYKKQDYIVNASLNTAGAVTSIGTALLLPLSAKAGPIGAAVGFSIMFSQGTYNAVRTADELRRLGFEENYVVPRAIENFFGIYEINKDIGVLTRKSALNVQDEFIPNIMTKNNELFFDNLKENSQSNLYYINKIIYPKIDLYLPYTNKISVLDHNELDISNITTDARLLKNEDHICLTNNTHFAEKNDDYKNIHANAIKNYANYLEIKNATSAFNPIRIEKKYYSIGESRYSINASTRKYLSFYTSNPTVLCPAINTSKDMIVKNAKINLEQSKLLASIADSKKANLYLVGYGDQGKHGNMISTLVAEKEINNLFNIHPATFLVNIQGGNRDDIFEFYDIIQNNIKEKGIINGGKGIDTLNFQGIKEKNLVINLDQKKNIETEFPIFKEIENIVASDQNDIIYGNNENNTFFGHNGDDKLYGNDGNDILYPGKGKDFLSGGAKNDTYVILKSDLINSGLNHVKSYISEVENKNSIIKNEIDKINVVKQDLITTIDKIKNSNNSPITFLYNLKNINYASQDFREIENKISNSIAEISAVLDKILSNNSLRSFDVRINNIKNKLINMKDILSKLSVVIKDLENLTKLENDSVFLVSDKVKNYLSVVEKINHIPFLNSELQEVISLFSSIKTDYEFINRNLINVTDGVKIIDNYDEHFTENATESYDAIMTDIENMTTEKSGSDLILGFAENSHFIPAIVLKNYFLSEKHQHIHLSDLKGNILTTKNGSLYEDNYDDSSVINKLLIDTYKMKLEDSSFSFESSALISSVKNVIGNTKSNLIKGNKNNNIIYGEGGLDKLHGMSGDDILSIHFDSGFPSNKKDYILKKLFHENSLEEFSSMVSGGEGYDSYLYSFAENEINNSTYLSIISNDDEKKNLDNLVFKDKEQKIKNIVFSKFIDTKFNKNHLKIEFLDVHQNNTYIVIVKNWFESETNRHLQLQLGEYLSLSESTLQQISNVLLRKEAKEFTVNLQHNTNDLRSNTFNILNFFDIDDKLKFEKVISNSKTLNFKIGRIENDLYIHFIEGKSNFIYARIKDYFYWKDTIIQELEFEINDEIVLNSQELDKILTDLIDGEFVEVAK